jgi:ElaB/YqjD/DUF883 family membrane-anchored ribosome-binding protein
MSDPYPSSPSSDNPLDSAARAAEELRAAASAKAEELRRVAQEQAKAFRQSASETAHSFSQGARRQADAFGGEASQAWEELREQAKDIHAEAERYVRANPTQALLAAVGAGFLLGLLFRR